MFKRIFMWVKEALTRVTGLQNNIQNSLHVQTSISNEMVHAIEEWDAMYKDKPYWAKQPSDTDAEKVISIGLPAMICAEKARMATLEMKSEITPKTEPQEVIAENGYGFTQDVPIGDTTRAEYLNEVYKDKVINAIRIQLEYGIAKGGLVIKPYVANNELVMDYIQADGFYPISFDASGRMTEVAFVQKIAKRDTVYSRVEYHRWENNSVTVINKAYKSTANENGIRLDDPLGVEVPLNSINEWANLQPETTINNVDRPLFAYFKMPLANNIDTYSPLGISGFARAKELIKEADLQYSRIIWEYEGSELAIDADRDALTLDRDENTGKDITDIPARQRRLFRRIDTNNEQMYSVFSPAIRDSSLFNGLNNLLMRIEDICGLARGTIADANVEARTATEISVLKQRSYAENEHIQEALQSALEDVVYIMNVYCSLYGLCPEGEYDVSFEWDDSIKVDKESELSKRITLMQNGISSKVELRMWYYGETEEQAVQALTKIQAQQQVEMQSQLEMQRID